MCGILAVIGVREPVGDDAAKALDRLRHRGPDDEGLITLWGERLALGHRRLSIFDADRRSQQPMICPQTGNAISFNGAIYNFFELKRELQALGERFATESDTEVILAAYRHWGDDAFRRFNGMWAILLHDARAGRLVVCRDRMGVKPLYVINTGERIAFASEIGACATAARRPISVNPDVVHDFLVGGAVDHGAETFVAGVSQVPPGALWRVDPAGRIERRRFHDWAEPEPEDERAGDPEALRALLLDAVRIRLRSDAASVSLLSGGLDSSIVAWAASQGVGERSSFQGVVTYGYADLDRQWDETEAARKVAAHLGLTSGHQIHLAETAPGPDELDKLFDSQEQPFATPSILAAFRTYRGLRERGVKVALTGEGADELFGGYTARYGNLLIRDHLRVGRFGAAAAMARTPHGSPSGALNQLVWDLPIAPLRALLRRLRSNVKAIAPSFWSRSEERFERWVAERRKALRSRLIDDIRRSALPSILRYADRCSMASGVEARTPFLDHRIVDYALRLPPSEKIGLRGGKLPLRAAFKAILPAQVTQAPKARGFGHAEQFQIGRMDLDEVLRNPPAAAHEFLDMPKLRSLVQSEAATMTLWWPICLLLWLARLERHAR
ncbi:MAG: asparagine synthase (glutamine-hydrolyzing) [Elsteraceae bacterium]